MHLKATTSSHSRQQYLFLSDLHLWEQANEITGYFEQFVSYVSRQQHIADIYILGDLFEYWIGDDYNNEFVQHIMSLLQQIAKHCHKLYLMHGNRDFLIGQLFCQQANCKLVDDPTSIMLDENRVLLMHGDTLCTDDTAYQQMRKQFRDPDWQAHILSQSIENRLVFARTIREKSEASRNTADNRAAHDGITDVNHQAVKQAILKHGCNILIHGHTHRPDYHEITLNEQGKATRIVLPAWYQGAGFLQYQQGKFSTHYL